MGRESLAEFMESNYGRLVSFTRSKLGDTSSRDGEDLVQDVMLSLVEGISLTGPIVSISAYVFRALRNRIIDEYRRKKAPTDSMDETNENHLTLYDILPDTKYEPRGAYARSRLAKEVEEALGELPELQRQAIIETEFHGRTAAELAEETATPVGTILARKSRGIKAMRNRLIHIKEDYDGIH